MRWYATIFLVWAWAGAAAADPLDKPFSAKPAELLAAAQHANANANDAPVVVLRDDAAITYDDRGRATRRYYVVAVIEKPAAIDGWGTYQLDWSPFYQDKPSLRARVVAPDGTVAELDPSLINDAPVVSESPSVFSDRRTMQAPLPRLSVGAVVEEEIAISDREPLLPAGEVERIYVGRPIPVEKSVITISAPSARALHVVARGFAKAPVPKKATAGGRTTWTYAFGAMDAAPHDFTAVPADVAEWPYVGVTTGASWAAIAKDYHRLVDERVKDGVPLPDGVRGATPRETVDRAVAWLHAHVRYTGIELSDSEILPFAPAQTAARGFGDCKDKASLLVALLRSAGIRADLVVLQTGPGTDLDRDLPGMGVFDHAIVRAQLDGKDLWIDATEQDLPAGQLPSRDQGRLALVVADDTRALVSTPIGAPADNLVREVRTYHVAEEAHATATEHETQRGLFWDDLRVWTRDTAHADITKLLTTYVTGAYEGKLTSVTDNHPADVTQPYEMTIEIGDVARVDTQREQIDAYLRRTSTFGHLPDVLTSDDADAADAVTRRTFDYVWTTPHVYEIENRLELPPGYTPPPLVAREQLALGTMTLTTTRALDHDTLVITYRLDTGKRRITPAELVATRAAVLALQKAQAEHVIIPLTSAALIHQGKLADAIAECQRVIKLHPKHAIHYSQLADAYRHAGMGPAARRAAQQGIQVEPTSGDAYDSLAFELRRDSAARDGGFDADRAGAIAAYRKALVVKPDHYGAITDFAAMLAQDEHGAPTGSRAEQQERIAVLRRGKALPGGEQFDHDLVDALIAAGQYADAEPLAAALPQSDDNAELRVTIAAALRGAKDAVALADTLTSGNAREAVLKGASHRLMLARAYDPMRALLAAASGGKPLAKDAAAILDTLKRVDLAKLPEADPKRPVLLAMLAAVGRDVPNPPWSPLIDKSLGLASALDVPAMRELARMPPELVVDLMAVTCTATPLDHDGWQVEFKSTVRQGTFDVARDRGRALLISVEHVPSGIGSYALTLLARKDDAAAARWIARAIDDLDRGGQAAKPWADTAKLYHDEIARAGGKSLSRDVVELVAALLAAPEEPARSAPILRRCATTGDDAHALCKRELRDALFGDAKWADVVAIAKDVPPVADQVPWMHVSALLRLGKVDDAAAVIDGFLAAHPHDRLGTYQRARVTIAKGDWTGALPLLDQVTADPDVTAAELNDIAWLYLVFDADPKRGGEIARRAEAMSKGAPNPGLANTLALADVEAGDPAAAWTHLEAAIGAHRHHAPSPADWYVLGRIAEAYGLRDDALADYQRARKDKTSDLPESGADLAAKRIAALGKP